MACIAIGARAQETPVALTGGTVYTVSGRPIHNGIVVIAGGKIAAVGAAAPIPANARRIDLKGAAVIPGLIDARSALFLSDADLSGSGTADQSVLDAADPYRPEAATALAMGVTTLYLAPGSRGGVNGLGAVVKLRPADPATGDGAFRVVRANGALELSIGISTAGRSTSLERLASFEGLRSLFRAAQEYGRAQERYVREIEEYQAAPAPPRPAPGQPAGAAPQRPAKPRTVPAQEIVLAALKGVFGVRIEAHREDDIRNALRLIDEFHLKATLDGATEAGLFAPELARRGIPIVFGPTLAGPPRLETASHSPNTATVLARAGVVTALTPGSRAGLASRFVRENAELAVAAGLSPEAALRAVTLDAAKALGVADRVGSIEAGKDADLVILSASPMERSSHVARVFVDGREIAVGAPAVAAVGPRRLRRDRPVAAAVPVGSHEAAR